MNIGSNPILTTKSSLKILPVEGRQVSDQVYSSPTELGRMSPTLTNTNQVTCYVYWMVRQSNGCRNSNIYYKASNSTWGQVITFLVVTPNLITEGFMRLCSHARIEK